MRRLSAQILAQIAIGVLLLVIIRSLGEVFRLQYLQGETLALSQVMPFVVGAFFAALALALTIVCYFAALHRASIVIAMTTVVVLFIYKVAVVG